MPTQTMGFPLDGDFEGASDPTRIVSVEDCRLGSPIRQRGSAGSRVDSAIFPIGTAASDR
jgi:hypothetical protein